MQSESAEAAAGIGLDVQVTAPKGIGILLGRHERADEDPVDDEASASAATTELEFVPLLYAGVYNPMVSL